MIKFGERQKFFIQKNISINLYLFNNYLFCVILNIIYFLLFLARNFRQKPIIILIESSEEDEGWKIRIASSDMN